jgi:hypothetical protein
MRRILSGLGILTLLCSTLGWAAPPAEKEKAATAAADKWLGLVDQGKYAESWKASSELFRAAVTSEKWDQALQGIRKPLGKVVSRKLKKAAYSDALPGAPKGEYVVIEFDTVFENRPASVESVTPMLDKDGTWRVSGYYIH